MDEQHQSETFCTKRFGCIVTLKDGEELPLLESYKLEKEYDPGNDRRVKINDTGWTGYMFLPYKPEGEKYQEFTLEEFLEKMPDWMVAGGKYGPAVGINLPS